MRFPFLLSPGTCSAAASSPDQCQEGRYAGAQCEVTQKGQQDEDMS
jgi:hypothetical protein